MNAQRKQTILTMFINCPVVSTDQIARYFTNAQPDRRASDCLCQLAGEKIIEGHNRGLAGKTKVWRLTKKGRELLGVVRPPVPLTSNKVDHYLSIGDVWQHLNTVGQLKRWRVELREPFAGKMKYCADAFACITTEKGTQLLMIESQLSSLTSNRWAEKWAVASAFFDSPAYSTASFQDFKNGKGEKIVIKPTQIKILVISTQQPETIQGGSRLPLIVCRDIKNAPL